MVKKIGEMDNQARIVNGKVEVVNEEMLSELRKIGANDEDLAFTDNYGNAIANAILNTQVPMVKMFMSGLRELAKEARDIKDDGRTETINKIVESFAASVMSGLVVTVCGTCESISKTIVLHEGGRVFDRKKVYRTIRDSINDELEMKEEKEE